MIFDHRTYACRPGTINKHLELYKELGLGPQTRALGQPALYGVTETGPINTYVHVWAYKDAADRAQRRAAMMADPQWQAYIKASGEAGYLISQENRILTPVPFWTYKG